MRILIVCTGNICRSPTAEALLRHHLEQAGLGDRVLVDSAGTEDWNVGSVPSALAIELAAARGYDLSGLRARQISKRDFQTFDLILGLDQGHIERLNRSRPDDCAAQIMLLMECGGVEPLEVPDPYFGGKEDYAYSLDLIESAMPGLVANVHENLGKGALNPNR